MGCFQSKESAPTLHIDKPQRREAPTSSYHKPKWQSDKPLTAAALKQMREEFWDTQPHYGGSKEIWQALKAASEADLATAKLILEAAGVVVAKSNMTICYDERGAKYELPKYVLSDPLNISKEAGE